MKRKEEQKLEIKTENGKIAHVDGKIDIKNHCHHGLNSILSKFLW